MSGLDTIGNDVFLLLVDSLEAIVQHELEGMPSDSATRPQRAQLRNSLLHLSSVNKGFRSVLKRRCFSTIRLYSKEYSQDKITSWMETVNRHDTLQHDMMKLVFAPQKAGSLSANFSSVDTLLRTFQRLLVLNELELSLPAGSVNDFKREVAKLPSVLFPTVTKLTIPSTYRFMVKQCPSMRKLYLSDSRERYMPYATARATFLKRAQKIVADVRSVSGQTTSLQELGIIRFIETPEMLQGLADSFSDVPALTVLDTFECGANALAQILTRWTGLRSLHLGEAAIHLYKEDTTIQNRFGHQISLNTISTSGKLTQEAKLYAAYIADVLFRVCLDLEVVTFADCYGFKVTQKFVPERDEGKAVVSTRRVK